MGSKFGPVFSVENTEDVKNEEPKKLFGPKRYEVKRNGEKTKYIELHSLNPSPHIGRIIKFCGVNIARRGEIRNEYRILVGKLQEMQILVDQGVD